MVYNETRKWRQNEIIQDDTRFINITGIFSRYSRVCGCHLGQWCLIFRGGSYNGPVSIQYIMIELIKNEKTSTSIYIHEGIWVN